MRSDLLRKDADSGLVFSNGPVILPRLPVGLPRQLMKDVIIWEALQTLPVDLDRIPEAPLLAIGEPMVGIGAGGIRIVR